MAAKNLYEVQAVLHDDNATDQSPISYDTLYVLARTPNQVTSKVIKELGDKLIFIEKIQLLASNDASVYDIKGGTIDQLVG